MHLGVNIYIWIPSWPLGFKKMSQMKETGFATKLKGNFLRLLVLLLAFSQLLSLNVVPVTRPRRSLEHDLHGHVVMDDNHSAHLEERGKMEGINGRMDIELNDYPGSGANNRHTRRKGCIDC